MDNSVSHSEGTGFYRQLLDNLDHAVIAVDTHGIVTYWNPYAESLLGWSAAEIVGSPLLMIPTQGEAKSPAVKRLDADDLLAEAVRLLSKDGTSLVVRLNQCPLQDANGNIVGYVIAPTRTAAPSPEPGTPPEIDKLHQIILGEVLDAAFLTDDAGRLVAVPLPGDFGYTEADLLSFINIAFVLQTDPFETRNFNMAELRNQPYTLIDKTGKPHALLVNMKPVSIMGGTRLYTCREVGTDRDNEDAIARSGLLRRVLDTIPVGVWVADKDGQIMLSNPADRQIWTEPLNNGRDAYNLHRAWSAETGQQLQRDDWALAKAIRSGEVTLNDVLEIEDEDGSRRTILNSAAPIRDEQGSVIGGIAVNQDITEQRRMEKAERKHRTFANALSNITAMLTSSLDLETVMERILDNVGRVVPHEAANIMLIEGDRVRIAFWHNYGPQCDELFRNNTYPLDMPMLKGMLGSGLPGLISDTRTSPDWIAYPETDWVRSAVSVPIRSRDTILGFLNLDSSEPEFFKPPDAERLRAFAYQAAIAIENARLFSTVREYADELETRVTTRTTELRASKEHVEAILEHSSDGIALVTNQGIITQVNPSFTQMFAIELEAARGLTSLPALLEHEAWERLKLVFEDGMSGGRSIRLDVTCHRLDGSTFDADLAIAPLFDPASQTYLYVCNVRDVTQQKMAERELRSALEKEKELNELKTRFVAMVSHEFRTPLASIQTSTDLLGGYHERLTSDHRNEIIQRIQLQIQRLTELLEDVMTVAKADTVGLVLDLSIVDLAAFCAETIKDLRYSTGVKRQITLESGGSLIVEIDQKLFHQVMVNLLSNAIKYSPENTSINVELKSAGENVVIQVMDHGIGIPQQDLPELFNAFHRASNVGDRYGTGLGLAVVKRAVEAHGGDVELESTLGVGTIFTITVPKRQPK